MYKGYIKRFIDCIMSICGLAVCFIPMCIIAIAIKIDSKGPVFFIQQRLGRNFKVFKIFKFRTMCVNAYEMGGVVTRSDDARITKVGAFLRRTSLDELPQMINILKGDMAIIGPRPILPVEFQEYEHHKRVNEFKKRFDVLPGMFCTIDIINRAPERIFQFEMDAEYAEQLNFLIDFDTFFKIIKVVVSGKNVYKNEVQ